MLNQPNRFGFSMDSPVGHLQISGNEDFISEISFCGEPISLESIMLPPHFILCRQELNDYFAGNRKVFSFPFGQEGSPFQKKVWKVLETIPYGETISYASLARETGDIKNSRAVGFANGKNKLAIVVPCHRVIGQNGNLTGYAGGLHRKAWLLQHEARIAHGVLQLNFKDDLTEIAS